MIKRVWLLILIFFTVVCLTGIADAKLIKIGTVTISASALGSGSQGSGAGGPGMRGGATSSNEFSLIYEDDQDLIWLDYTAGNKEWPDQVEWALRLNDAGAMSYHFDPGIVVTWTGCWRLPLTVDVARKCGYDGSTSAGYNITSSEMGHLFYVSLGNLGYYDKTGKVQAGWGGLKNTGPFKNLSDTVLYWSENVYSLNPDHAWTFLMYTGSQDNNSFTCSYSRAGLAVRPGKVVISK